MFKEKSTEKKWAIRTWRPYGINSYTWLDYKVTDYYDYSTTEDG